MQASCDEGYRRIIAATSTIGPLMRDWRDRRSRQFDLVIDVGMSTRHLSFVENGRSRPSPELILAVAEHLDVPLRERNTLLLAAGFAPRYPARDLADGAMQRISASLQRMLDLHDPYPGVVIDRQWNVLLTNCAATALTDGLPEHVLAPQPGPRWTSRHKEPGKPAEHRLFDQIWVSPTLANATIDRRTKHSGDGSDHDPAWITLEKL